MLICKIQSVSTGLDFGMAVDDDGNLWAFGRNLAGSLGLGDGCDSEIQLPSRVEGDLFAIGRSDRPGLRRSYY